MDAGAFVSLVVVAFVAQLTSATILGSIASARAGKAVCWSYIAGLTAARLIQGLVGLGAITALLTQLLGLLDLGRYADALARYGDLLLVLGGAALVFASVRELVRGQDEQEDESGDAEDAPLSPRGAFAWGFGVTIVSARQWIFTSIAITSIGQMGLGVPASIFVWVGYLGASAWLAATLLTLRYLRPGSALAIIDRAADWMHRSTSTILAWFGLVVGAGLLLYGLYGLLA